MSVVYNEKISFNVHLHGQMSVKMSKCLFLQTFDHEFEVYNIEMQIYRQMTMKHLFIIQATGQSGLRSHEGIVTNPRTNDEIGF